MTYKARLQGKEYKFPLNGLPSSRKSRFDDTRATIVIIIIKQKTKKVTVESRNLSAINHSLLILDHTKSLRGKIVKKFLYFHSTMVKSMVGLKNSVQ